MRIYRTLAVAGVSLMALSMPTFAQDIAAVTDDTKADPSEIIVTGTLIRGIAPGGTSVLAVSQEKVAATGASTTAQLLQTIPQLASFGALQFPAGSTVSVNRPNLRNLPGFNTSGGSTTLVLLDGHRIVGMGIGSTTPDPDFIPPGAISRLEIVPDGGSAIYGSDAVAGVMNFITRKDFSGLELSARTGFADDYTTFDASGTAGHKWDGGSAFLSYSYSQHDAIFGRDRDFVQVFPSAVTGYTSAPATRRSWTCAPGNVTVATTSPTTRTVYALPFTTATAGPVAGRANDCDLSDDASLYPREHHHSVMAGLNQELSPWLSVNLRGYYFNRELDLDGGAFTSSQTAGLANGTSRLATTAGFLSHRVGSETTQTVDFAWGGPYAAHQNIGLESWGVSGEFTGKLGGDWQVRLLGNYGESTTESHAGILNSTALGNALKFGLFDPYDPLASNPAAYAAVKNWETFGRARQQLSNFRVIADGSLISLPGGAVKLAAGLEYIREGLVTTTGDAIPGFATTGSSAVLVNGNEIVGARAGIPTFSVRRNVKSAFGELSVPLFGADNEGPMLRELTLSLSGRYDDYSDVGDTFNPKVGVTYKPVSWIRLRGSWGKSFNAPSLAEASGAAAKAANFSAAALGSLPSFLAFYKPPDALVTNGTFPAFDPRQTVVTIGGNDPNIQPQRARTLSLGADIDPPFIPGLRLGATYWRISLFGQIGTPPFFDRNTWWNNFRHKITLNPTDAQVAAALGRVDTIGGGAQCTGGLTTNCVYAIFDTTKTNLGDNKFSGIDFYLNYQRETSFGSVDFAFNGTRELTREVSTVPGTPFVDRLSVDTNVFRSSMSVGANISNLRAQVTWYYRQGYDITPVTGLARQTHVGAFNVFNLFFKYDVNGEGMFKDLAFTLNVDNVFDQDPPIDRGPKALASQSGYGNGSTLGRLFQFGVSKRF